MVLADLELKAGMKCIQHILLAFNAIFTFTGVILISVGSTVKNIYSDYAAFVESRFFSPSIIIISIGCLVFMIALFGCYGAIKLSVTAITIYCSLLATVYVLEMMVGLAGYIMEDQIENMLTKAFNRTIREYKTDEVAEKAIDALQNALYCCGATGPDDWSEVMNKTSDSKILLPASCCALYEGEDQCIAVKQMGCLPQLEFLIDQSSLLLTSTVMMIALMQLLGVIFACKLGRQLKEQKLLRARFMWEVKENVISGNDFVVETKCHPQGEYAPLPSYTELFSPNEVNEKVCIK